MKLTTKEKELIRKQGHAVKNYKFISRGYDHFQFENIKTGQRLVIRY